MSHGNGEDKGITLHSNGEDFAIETGTGRFVAEIDPETMQPTMQARRFVLADKPVPKPRFVVDPDVLAPTAELSSLERSERMDMVIAQLSAVTKQMGALTRVTDAQLGREKEYNALTAALETRQRATETQVAAFASASFLARLRRLLTGR